MKMNQIAILTDFGLESNYVGIMKGVISGISPNAAIIDLCHSVEPHNIRQAAFILQTSYKYFPNGTVFCCVVDPHVGSKRNPLVVKSEKYCFVAPDNGLLTYTLSQIKNYEIVIPNEIYYLDNISHTFHGRDIFAPVSANLCIDLNIKGKIIGNDEIDHLPAMTDIIEKDRIIGEAIYSDTFGNIITTIRKDSIIGMIADDNIYSHKMKILINDVIIDNLSRSYIDSDIGKFLAYIGSSGYLEIGISNGNAAERIGKVKKVELIPDI